MFKQISVFINLFPPKCTNFPLSGSTKHDKHVCVCVYQWKIIQYPSREVGKKESASFPAPSHSFQGNKRKLLACKNETTFILMVGRVSTREPGGTCREEGKWMLQRPRQEHITRTHKQGRGLNLESCRRQATVSIPAAFCLFVV